MTPEEEFNLHVKNIIGDDLTINSVAEAEQLHEKFIQLRVKLFEEGVIEIMPHYRGEQKYSWDIRPGIFRPPLNITDPAIAKQLELKAVNEFETVIHQKVGKSALRDLFNGEKHGREWDLLFQAQHAGVKTTLTDWTAFIISALYFTTEESKDAAIENSDGQLWCYITPMDLMMGHSDYPDRHTFYDLDPFNLKTTVLINPATYISEIQDRIFEYRMYRQKGRFVLPASNKCHIPLNEQEAIKKFLLRFKIPAGAKDTIRRELAQRNIIRSNMYIDENPDRQNLIDEINQTIYQGL